MKRKKKKEKTVIRQRNVLEIGFNEEIVTEKFPNYFQITSHWFDWETGEKVTQESSRMVMNKAQIPALIKLLKVSMK